MAEITYRMATAADAQTLAELRWAMEAERHDEHDAATVTQVDFITESREILAGELARGGFRAWVAEADGQIVSCVVLMCWPVLPSLERLQRSRGMVSSVYTVPTYRRLGIARHLMNTLIEDAQKRNMQRLILWASEMGRPLYENLGFVVGRGFEIDLEPLDDADCNLDPA